VWGEESWSGARSETYPVPIGQLPDLVREAVDGILHLSILELDANGGFLVRSLGLGLVAATISLAIRFVEVDEGATRVDVTDRLNTAYGAGHVNEPYADEVLSAIRARAEARSADGVATP
jgi:hypothetical protein